MPISFDTALKSVIDAVAEFNLSLPEDKHVSNDPDAVLFGDGSGLDSLGLVNVVMTAEQYISDETGEDIVLASEAAMSRKRSPYRSLRALAEYAVEVCNQEAAT